MMFAKFFYNQLPPWARPAHPVMRHALRYDVSRRQTMLRGLLVLVLVAVALGISYAYTLQNPDTNEMSLPDTIREVLYYPLSGAMLLMQLLAFALTINLVALERQKGTWESLQITLVGAQTSIRSQWALVFYRVRWILLAVFVARLVYIILLMYEITDFEGRAIDVRIIGISPEVSLEVAVFLLAALMTAAVLQPFVVLAFDAGLGVLVATATPRRNVGILTTVTLLVIRVVLTVGALILGNDIVTGQGTTPRIVDMSTPEAWGRVLLLTTQGDYSLRLLNLETLGNLWADLKDGIYLGGIVLGLVMLQAVIANAMVLFAAWRAARPGKD
jgi:hypothetical protein